MPRLRWSLPVVALLVWSPQTQAAPAPANEPPIEWVRVDGDFVMGAEAYEATQKAKAEAAAQAATEAANGNGTFKPTYFGEGFNAFGLGNWGDYTIKLATSLEGDIETYRAEAQEAADQINALLGMHMAVAAGTITGPTDPLALGANPGEIVVMIASSSPCDHHDDPPGPPPWAGCGGPRTFDYIDGELRYASGAVWLRPGLPEGNPNIQQAVLLHEIGHALGLDHFPLQLGQSPDTYLGQRQLMHPFVGDFDDFHAGDLNGIKWTSGPHPSNDDIANADLVCPGDSTMSARTWLATPEAGEAAHHGSAARRSVWYKYVPRPEQHGGQAIITTVNDGFHDFNSVLDVYTGDTTPSTFVDSDDGVGTTSLVQFTVDSAETYWIAVDGAGGVNSSPASRGEMDVVFNLPALSSAFVPLCAPARILDTRPGAQTVDGMHKGVGPVLANTAYTLPIAGRAEVPPGATSVVLNVTAVVPTGGGFVTVYPCGDVPVASNLNFVANDVIANSVLVKLDGSGRACFFTSVTTHLLVDISGFFLGTDGLTPLPTPGRLMDTRHGSQTVDGLHAGVGRLTANTPYELPVTGRAGVPGGAVTVALNVTAVVASPPGGFVTVWPCGQPQPNASNLNFLPGETIPNMVLARVGTGGKVCLVSATETDLLVDVSGYFADTTTLNPLTSPQRVLDTRPTGLTVDAAHQGTGRVAAGGVYQLPVAGRAGVPVEALSVVLNVTAAGPSAGGFITIFPCGQNQPVASNLNFAVGDVIANSVVTRVGTAGKVCIYSFSETDVIVDVSGYLP